MTNEIIVKIKLYGFFRKYNIEYIFLPIPFNCSIKNLKKILLREFVSINEFIIVDEILNFSIIATCDNILNDDYLISSKEEFFLFPPVNGG